jgi:hypothetical protein
MNYRDQMRKLLIILILGLTSLLFAEKTLDGCGKYKFGMDITIASEMAYADGMTPFLGTVETGSNVKNAIWFDTNIYDEPFTFYAFYDSTNNKIYEIELRSELKEYKQHLIYCSDLVDKILSDKYGEPSLIGDWYSTWFFNDNRYIKKTNTKTADDKYYIQIIYSK